MNYDKQWRGVHITKKNYAPFFPGMDKVCRVFFEYFCWCNDYNRTVIVLLGVKTARSYPACFLACFIVIIISIFFLLTLSIML